MNQSKDFRYMSIETVNDVDNTFLSRRELTCKFAGLGGKLRKSEAVDMVTKEFKLDGKIVIPIKMKNEVGRNTTSGTFYVYEDETLAKKHVNPTIFARLEKAKKEEEVSAAKEEEEKKEAEAETKAEDTTEEKKEESAESEKTEAKSENQEEKKEEKSE